MEITKETQVADILEKYGDIVEVMGSFGIKRVGRYSLRALVAKALTVEWAARIHRVPVNTQPSTFTPVLPTATFPPPADWCAMTVVKVGAIVQFYAQPSTSSSQTGQLTLRQLRQHNRAHK